MSTLLAISDLRVEYAIRRSDRGEVGGSGRRLRVIDGLSLEVAAGETLAVVGESGSGKSTLAETVVGLVRPVAGSIRFDGTELANLSRRAGRRQRRRIQMVAQNPLLALSPRRRIATQIEEPLQVHTSLNRAQRATRVDEMLAALDLSSAVRRRFPHELSGGQAQRAVLARALILEPSLILFDEPTSALDVSVQAGVLNLLRRLKVERNLTYLFITHDLAVARHLADRVAVMRAGEIVEQRNTADLFGDPRHPYTRSLLASCLTV
ncbi:MAG: ABC transporter ATP-binding protein [bacterium]|nr:ABC transporter ATP-binding protein [bacterium]MXZ29722.1 ABC transporter ATP-binding protein [Acidimicrobiia bacterium]MDE0669850.1 ABC transporter ATP-binding protein [bacterium]MYB23832.1 ABC transporter ATP-binding protein [Acidimicrobiia bacterium]MYE67393.1 ABC transporter ATP-binding protein [Acidimicrobiia bacterium]